MSRKKILFICTDPASGMLPYAGKIINTLVDSDNDYEFFGLFLNKGEFSYEKYIETKSKFKKMVFLNSSVNKIPSFVNKILPIKIYLEIIKLCHSNKIDIVHCLTTEFCLGNFLYLLQSKYKILYTVHDLYPHANSNLDLKSKVISKIIDRGVRLNIKRLKILITSSKAQFNILESRYPNKYIYYHPFPSLVTNAIKKGSSTCPELNGINKYILFFGRLETYKGVEILYNAFLKDNYLRNNYHLVIAGVGHLYFPTRIDEEKVIKINRFIDENEINKLFENADCVVYPYSSATQSGVLSIAYKFLTPTVISNVDYFLENAIIDKSAYVFENGDIQSLINAITKAVNSKNNKERIASQIFEYNELYSDETLLNSMNHIYESI